MKTTTPQTESILNFLLLGCKITPLEALQYFGCFRLASRISEAQQRYDIRIDREMIKTESGKYIAQYYINQKTKSL